MSGYNKYHAVKTTVDGITFDSKHEADRYIILRDKQKRGEISDLRLQVPFLLLPAQYKTVSRISKKTGKPLPERQKLVERECNYIADFVYVQDGETVVEDAKGRKTREYRLKKKMLFYFHGKEIKET